MPSRHAHHRPARAQDTNNSPKNRRQKFAATLRGNPTLLPRALLQFALSLSVIAAVLWIFGAPEKFQHYSYLAGTWMAFWFLGEIERRTQPEPPSEPAPPST
ncbi:hypothetical protein [Nocardioides aurantiacus]|uniref:Uncharacterized protein n=1 Tax=Nocardioides aurantiacus TaxID=86796 RepID=A0A3N2CTM1_9ACTN|nr:hypothetical protein [Nocardioides aurantiacus]ROR90883.1 hypothetical protein EDD33_1732 [Nocardioides aurantiacus]